jgi:phosphatidylglycerol:prolipoprotein diacylglycerol transferase
VCFFIIIPPPSYISRKPVFSSNQVDYTMHASSGVISIAGGGMYPVLFTVGSLEIRSYLIFMSLGAALGIIVGAREAKRVGIDSRDTLIFCLLVIPIALGIGLLNGLLFDLDFYRALALSILLLDASLVSFGIIFGAYLLGALFALWRKVSVGRSLDVITLALPLILGVTRIGCLLNGCCYGRETDGIGGVFLPGYRGEWAYRYPTQVWLMVFDLVLFGWLWLRRKRSPYEGSQTIAFLIVFSVGRLVIDSFRPLTAVVGPLSLHQLMSIVIFIGALAFYIRRRLARSV